MNWVGGSIRTCCSPRRRYAILRHAGCRIWQIPCPMTRSRWSVCNSVCARLPKDQVPRWCASISELHDGRPSPSIFARWLSWTRGPCRWSSPSSIPWGRRCCHRGTNCVLRLRLRLSRNTRCCWSWNDWQRVPLLQVSQRIIVVRYKSLW